MGGGHGFDIGEAPVCLRTGLALCETRRLTRPGWTGVLSQCLVLRPPRSFASMSLMHPFHVLLTGFSDMAFLPYLVLFDVAQPMAILWFIVPSTYFKLL